MESTTIEQSYRLLEFGLSADTADMQYQHFGHKFGFAKYPSVIPTDSKLQEKSIPSWSLSALMDLLPNEIEVGVDKLCLKIDKYYSYWYVRYLDKNENGIGYCEQKLIDSVYNVICYLFEEKLI